MLGSEFLFSLLYICFDMFDILYSSFMFGCKSNFPHVLDFFEDASITLYTSLDAY
jgi:hypothetical protein